MDGRVVGLTAPCLVVVSPGGHGFGAAVEGPSDPVGQRLTVGGFGGDVVGGAGLVVVVGDDAAHQLGGVAAGAAASHVHTGGGLGVFVVAFPGDPLVQVGGVGVAATRQSDVQKSPAGGFTEDGVGGVGGDALGGVHSDGVAVGDVVAQGVPGARDARAVAESACGNPIVFGVDGVDAPAVAVAHRVGLLVDVVSVVDAEGGVVAAADDQIADAEAGSAGGGDGGGLGGGGVVAEAPVGRGGHLGGV